jgi:Fur family zinc uptake transcriptional regulator
MSSPDHGTCDHGVAHRTPEDLKVALERARDRADAAGQRWTQPRERVYELLLQAGAPVKAYDLMDAFQEGRAAKPPTVYRALEFLEHVGLVHRIASLNAYMACGAEADDHAAAFLICDCCGSAEEFEPGRVTSAAAAAAVHHFKPRAIALEVRGLCEQCAA